jgi:hypothetical protein
MSVGVTKDYKLKVRNLHASHTLGWSTHECDFLFPKKRKKVQFVEELVWQQKWQQEQSTFVKMMGRCRA